jgi:hypothetical protein
VIVHVRLARWWMPLLAVLLVSCATAKKFAERSEQELAAGQTDKAYQSALIAYRRDPHDPKVRDALSNAANARIGEWRHRVHNVAVMDTLAAARQSLDLTAFRREVTSYGVTVREDAAYDREEAIIRRAAAAGEFRDGVGAMRARQPKIAYGHFELAERFLPTYRDVGKRKADALNAATTRVAILPFEDQAGSPGLSRRLSDLVYAEAQKRLGPSDLVFTRFLTPDQVYSRMTVNELDDLTRDKAIALGRRIGADRVVWGRCYAPNASTNTNRYRETIWRREEVKDTSGTTVRYTDTQFGAVQRERQVSVKYETEVIDVETGDAVSRREGVQEAKARTFYTDFRPNGNFDAYCLVPPDMKQRDPDRARRVESGWHDTFGSWTLPKALECTRNSSGRSRYSNSWRQEFVSDTWGHPFYLDDLPPESELISIAFDPVWQPVLAAIQEQDDR